MNLSIFVKSYLALLYESSGVVKLNVKYISKHNYLILMYHRVIPVKETTQGLQAGMYVEPETFDMHMYYNI